MRQDSTRLIAEVSEKLNEKNVKQIAIELWVRLQKQKQLNRLDQIINEVGSLYSMRQGRLRARLSSAKELSQEQVGEITDRLEKKFGKKIDLHQEIDPDLMGGIRVQIGDEIYDVSYAAKLHQLKQKLEGGV